MKHKNRIYKRYKFSTNLSTEHFATSISHSNQMNQPLARRPFHFPLPIVSLFIMPRLPESFFTNQDMMVQQPLGQYSSQLGAPNWSPNRHQRSIGSHKAEALYLVNKSHALSGTIARDRSTGTHPGLAARMDANNNVGAEKVWRTPSRNL